MVKCSRCRPGVAQRVGRVEVYLCSSMTAALEGGERSAARSGRNLPPRKTRYPFYRRLGGPQGRSGRAENLVPTGIRSRTVQPVVSRYTDWASSEITFHKNFPTSLAGLHIVFKAASDLKGLYSVKHSFYFYWIFVTTVPLSLLLGKLLLT